MLDSSIESVFHHLLSTFSVMDCPEASNKDHVPVLRDVSESWVGMEGRQR